MSRARSISWRRTSAMLAAMSGRSIFGFRIEPRSPPVQVATWTSTPCATYMAVLAAPLLDSSSGWACTCMSRRPAPGRAAPSGCWDMVASLGVASACDDEGRGADPVRAVRRAAGVAASGDDRGGRRGGRGRAGLAGAGRRIDQSTPKVRVEPGRLRRGRRALGDGPDRRHGARRRLATRPARCRPWPATTRSSASCTFRPTSGTNTVTVRTEREATAVDVPGCIADGQDHPR